MEPITKGTRRRVIVAVALLSSSCLTLPAQTDFVRVKSFGNPLLSAATPTVPPLEASDGNLYGTTAEGGIADAGTLYKVSKDGSGLTLLHSFVGGTGDGQMPLGSVVEAGNGALYGTTALGGSNNSGTLFRINKDGSSYFVLRHFTNAAEGPSPRSGLLKASDGNLYGTTSTSLFKFEPPTTNFTVLRAFTSPDDGAAPQGVPVEGSDGFLYGVTLSGGTNNLGTIFKIDKNGNGYSLLLSFSGTNGRNPQASLFEGSDGLLYGTTSYRASTNYGAVFRIAKEGTNFSVLHYFTGANQDGLSPLCALVEATNGVLYGTTTNGGSEGQGIIFQMDKDGGNYSIKHHFSWSNNDGRVPICGLSKASDGTFYGTTSRGGSADYGSLFEFDPNTTNLFSVVSFSWSGADGWNSQSRLTEGSDGFLYGVTFNGGSNDFGTVFKIKHDRSSYIVLHHFDWHADGAFPKGSLIEGTNGMLYGTTCEGGFDNFGTLYRLNKDASGFSVLHHFSGRDGDGGRPQAGLIQASDGNFYGTTSQGGNQDWGALFAIHGDGSSFINLRSIDTANIYEIEPLTRLVYGSDGAIYGTASGGAGEIGSVFGMNLDGSSFTNVQIFTNSVPSLQCKGLLGDLIEGADDALYGTAFHGGQSGQGAVFKVNKDGSGFAVLRSFSANADARNPAAGLARGESNLLYGVSLNGSAVAAPGATNRGTVFSIDSDGSGYGIIHSFDVLQGGRNPASSLVLASDGAFYGTASTGGDMGGGTIFSLAEPSSFLSITLKPSGTVLQLKGTISRSYAVQSSTNLIPSFWESLPGTAIWTNGYFEFSDPSPVSDTKFYRARTE